MIDKLVPEKLEVHWNNFNDSEIIIGLVGAVGTDMKRMIDCITERLQLFHYEYDIIKISKAVIESFFARKNDPPPFERVMDLMSDGNELRKQSGNNGILALGVVNIINSKRERESDDGPPIPKLRKAYIIDSLKHPDEVARLREIYGHGFYLIGVFADQEERQYYLEHTKGISIEDSKVLINRDSAENIDYGQATRETFHLADFFIHLVDDIQCVKNNIWRVLDLIFGDPFITPSFDEYAMFMAFASSLRSGDLSRQVGAVVADNEEILGTGANDCPKYGGGLYYPKPDVAKEGANFPRGRDLTRGFDSNQREKNGIIDNIVEILNNEGAINKGKLNIVKKALANSKLADITEYGRVVHAEMEALLSCARHGHSVKCATLYCTTFPCHNCAKHIIDSGITKVVYIEPYPKSKAEELHDDAIFVGIPLKKGELRQEAINKVHFIPFIGVGPRRFFDLFSMKRTTGTKIRRKDEETGDAIVWHEKDANLREPLIPISYLELEDEFLRSYLIFMGAMKHEKEDGAESGSL